MESLIYTEICARLTDAAVVTWIQGKGFTAPQDIKWFEDQVNQLLAEEAEQNKAQPLRCPAVLVQFEDSAFDPKTNPTRQIGSGKLIIHIVQQQTGNDGVNGASTHTAFKKLVKYKDIITDALNGFTLPCTARLILVGDQVDHLNRSLRDDTITFNWSGTRLRETGVP